MGTLLEDQCAFFICLTHILEWEMFQTEVVEENQNTHFMFNNLFFFF